MAQLQRMDARLDTLSTELYQVNVHVGRIARRQATMGGFVPEPTPSPPHLVASEKREFQLWKNFFGLEIVYLFIYYFFFNNADV